MFVFQFLLIAVVIIVAIAAVRSLPGDRSLAVKRLVAILFAVAAIVSIMFPTLITMIANFLGIGRGADLLLYVFVLAALLFAVSNGRARARSDARVTQLARSVALMEARIVEQQTTRGS